MKTSLEPPATTSPGNESPPETALFRVEMNSRPSLADHGFQGLVILPGSYYLALAAQAVASAREWPATKFTSVEFHAPLILSDSAIDIAADIGRCSEHGFRCSFRETRARSAGEVPCTTLEVEGVADAEIHFPRTAIAPEIFLQNAEQRIDRETFYRRLHENGNRYGPCFQGLRQLARRGNEVVARLELAEMHSEEEFFLDPLAVDAAVQSLMMFGLERGRTLVLRSIEQVMFRRTTCLKEGWVSTRLGSGNPPGSADMMGDVEVRDETGGCWLQLRGVRLTAHDPGKATRAASVATNIVVAATFTAEPMAEVFRFWGDTLALPTRLEFAPYGQVFQQLLDSESAFHRNRDGCNMLLVNLADWAAGSPSAPMHFDRAKIEKSLRGLECCTLPNGLEIAHLNRHETEYVYREIFLDRCYVRHGIRLPKTGTVIDIGANIGLFSLFVRSEAPGVSVLAYEPSPAAFRALQANCEAYSPGLHPFNVGVAERRGQASLTCYEKSSVFSTFHADQTEDGRAIHAVAANLAREQSRGAAMPDDELIDELLVDRLNFRTVACSVISVSDIIRENGLRRVDLLKVDAEKCELAILRGVADEHWPMIEQVVVEVHDRTRALLDEVQGLLARRGFHCAVVEENLLAGSGLFNVYATRGEVGAVDRNVEKSAATVEQDIERLADEFGDALSAFAQRATSLTLLAIVPGETKLTGTDRAASFARIEDKILRRVRELPRVRAVGSNEILARYPSRDFHQGDAGQLGHVPFTADGFAAIGTSLFRMLAAAHRRPFKVIALDCDHTLWQGGCGEDGPRGVVVTAPHRALQEFMIRQMQAGMILCLCSKNHATDVWAVFEQNPGMALRREHVAAARINWSSKSDNLRSLAAELNIGLASVILLDDNPLECAEVRANCPEILVLPLPAADDRIPHFLEHVWAFDHFNLTAEDLARTQMVREGTRREEYRQQVPTLASFIAGLGLQVAIFEPDAEVIERLAQLTQRTNQFNFSTVRRSAGELLRFMETPNHRALAVKVTDRFGDYGVVGEVLYEAGEHYFQVDTFLLSCRVLGRGVEHQVLADLGRRALAEGKAWIDIRWRPTEKNQPARDFVASLGVAPTDMDREGSTYRLDASRLADLHYGDATQRADPAEIAASGDLAATPLLRTVTPEKPGLSENFETVAGEWDDAHKIAAAVEIHRLRAAGFAATTDTREQQGTLSGKLLQIWRRILGDPHIGPDDKFMEAGGTSLGAVQIVAAVRRELQLPLSVVAFFECPTVRLLSEKLSPAGKEDATANAAIARGARRAQRMRRSP